MGVPPAGGSRWGNVGQPQLVRLRRGEVALHEVVVDGRADFAVQAAFLREMQPDPLLGAQPPHTPLRPRNAGLGLDLVRDEPIPEPALVAVDGERDVGHVTLSQSRWDTGSVRQTKYACLEKPRPLVGHRDRDLPIGSPDYAKWKAKTGSHQGKTVMMERPVGKEADEANAGGLKREQ